MKILITHELFPPEIVGGGELLFLKIAEKLVEKGNEVEVLTSGDSKIKSYKGIETDRIPINRYLMNLTFLQILNKAKDFDLIQTSGGNMAFPSWLAAKILKKPVCCYINHIAGNYWIDIRGQMMGRVFENMERFFLTRDYDAVIFQNNLAKKMGLEIGIDKKRIFIDQPGIDYKKFQLKNIKRESIVLFVGSLNMSESLIKIKGLEYLIETARALPDVKFMVVGGGTCLNGLKRNSPKNVVFTGPLTGRPLIELYNKSLIFCLPSLIEGFGISILEAMASGCSVVSTIDLGQRGIIIKPKDSTVIVKSIKKLLENKGKTEDEGRKNRELAKKFTWDRFINNLTEIYELIYNRY